MLDIQLGRRNLSPIQRIAVVEKKRAYYEKKAKEKQAEYHGNQYDKKGAVAQNFVEVQNNRTDNETNSKLAKLAGVGKETYCMGAKILNSNNEELKKRVQSGKTSISAGYKELTQIHYMSVEICRIVLKKILIVYVILISKSKNCGS